MAALITPCGREFAVSARDLNAGFNKGEMDHLIGGDCKAFRLKTGGLLLLNSLACAARTAERNDKATWLLRDAVDDPGGEVCGYALLLDREESGFLSPSEQAALLLDSTERAPTVLLLDRNEEVRSVLAEGLERQKFWVVQVRSAAEAASFSRAHCIHILVADVSSLCPNPLETRRFIQEGQPECRALLISGYDESTVASLYPGLLTGAQFLQKPFALNLMASFAHRMNGNNKTGQPLQFVAHGNQNSGG